MSGDFRFEDDLLSEDDDDRRSAARSGKKPSKITSSKAASSQSRLPDKRPTKVTKPRHSESEDEPDNVVAFGEATASLNTKRFKHLEARDHMLERPNMWIGSVNREMRETWGFNEDGAYLMTTDTPYGLERLFLEVTANYCDHLCKGRRQDPPVDPGEVFVTAHGRRVTVKNRGVPMPIARTIMKNGEEGPYIPEACFGIIFSGSNFDKDKDDDEEQEEAGHDGGANGIGVKAANVMSDYFQVKVKNHVDGIVYVQEWTNNMTPKPPVITHKKVRRSSVRVTYDVEMERFGYEKDSEYSADTLALFWRHSADASFSAKLVVNFNGFRMDYGRLSKYGSLYFGKLKHYLMHYQWKETADVVKRADGTEYDRNGSLPLVEMLVVSAPNKGRTVGIANSILNIEGGAHVAAAQETIIKPLIDELNAKGQPKKTTPVAGGRGKAKAKPKDDKKKSDRVTIPTITMRDGKPHFHILISVRVFKPDWGNSQSKVKLQGPKPTIAVDQIKLDRIKRWPAYKALVEILEGKRGSLLSKSDGRRISNLGNIKSDDAGDAGTKFSQLCDLYGVEGDSAHGTFVAMVKHLPHKRKRNGCIIFRGKLINAYKNGSVALAGNKEFVLLKKMLGIKEDVDYTIKENCKRDLRYGRFIIMTDADIDGSHIRGLILAMFSRLWRTILDSEFVQVYHMPIIQAFMGRQRLPFYFDHEFQQWQQETPNHRRYRLQYYKGLGSYNPKTDIPFFVSNPHQYIMFQDHLAQARVAMAFGPNSSNERKKWIAEPSAPYATPDEEGRIHISEFVDTELKQYSIASLLRHIPKRDGLRVVNRKALFTALKVWRRSAKPEMKPMVSFVAKVISKARYHNGEAIDGVVKRMCMDFVGSNNVPYFIGEGILGSRVCGGKKAAKSRYLKILPNTWWLNHVFRAEDDAILNYYMDEGDQVEPEFYLPVIPMTLVNEVWSVATGYSSYIPAHHPLDIIDYYIRRLREQYVITIHPWYRGFKGTISVVDRRGLVGENNPKSVQASASSSDEESEDDEDDDDDQNQEDDPTVPKSRPKKSERYSMITIGKYHQTKDKITVTELPVGVWTDKYKSLLYRMVEGGKIKSFNDNECDDDTVGFEINGFGTVDKDQLSLLAIPSDIGLIRSYGLTNLVLLDDDSRPIRFQTIDAILDDFFEWRLPFYSKRRAYLLEQMKVQVEAAHDKANFIQAVVTGKLRLRDEDSDKPRRKEDVKRDILALGLNPLYYDRTVFSAISNEAVADLMEQVANIEAKFKTLQETQIYDLWLNDLDELRAAYIKHYGDDRPDRVVGDFYLE